MPDELFISPRSPAPGTVVPLGSLITPGGEQGVAGQPGTTGLQGPQGYEGNLVGSIIAWPSVTPPVGYLVCDGSAQLRSIYGNLYTALGGAASPWGQGDGATTFNLPDLRSRMIIGYGQGAGLTNRLLAVKGGAETHVYTVAEMPSHGHTLTDSGHAHVGGNHQHLTMNHGHGLSWSDPTHGHTNSHSLLFSNPAIYGTGTQNSIGWNNTTAYPYLTITVNAAATGISAGIAGSGNFWTDTDAARGGVATDTRGTGIGVVANGSGAAVNWMNPFVVLVYVIRASYQVPVTGPAVPIADTTQPGLLNTVSGASSDYVGGDNACHDLASQISLLAPIWRGYQAVGNSNFEVDARTIGAGSNFATTAGSGFSQDRWQTAVSTTSTARGTFKQTAGQVFIAGSNVCLSSYFSRFTLTAQQAALGVSDYIYWLQSIEGIKARPLFGNATTAGIVCRSSVAPFSFGFFIRDSLTAWSLTHLCTISSANTWTLIQIPNILAFSGTFPTTPGGLCYTLGVCLAAGTNFTASGNNVWLGSNLIGAQGQGNFASSAINSTFDLGLVQHYAGAAFNGLLETDFNANLRECARYYQKNCAYNTAPCLGNWLEIGQWVGSTTVRLGVRFGTEMAKTPTIRMAATTATLNQVYVDGMGVVGISGAVVARSSGMSGLTLASTPTGGANSPVLGDWDADTGW